MLTVVTGRSGVARPRAVAGEGVPRLRAAAAVLAQVGEAPEMKHNKTKTKFHSKLQLICSLQKKSPLKIVLPRTPSRRRCNAEKLIMLIKA